MSGSPENCRDMVVHQGALWYPVGVDDNTAEADEDVQRKLYESLQIFLPEK